MRQTTSDACQSPGRGSGMRATCKSPWPWPGVDFRSSSPPPTLGSGVISLTQPSPQGRKTQLPCPSPPHPRGWACPCPTLSPRLTEPGASSDLTAQDGGPRAHGWTLVHTGSHTCTQAQSLPTAGSPPLALLHGVMAAGARAGPGKTVWPEGPAGVGEQRGPLRAGQNGHWGTGALSRGASACGRPQASNSDARHRWASWIAAGVGNIKHRVPWRTRVPPKTARAGKGGQGLLREGAVHSRTPAVPSTDTALGSSAGRAATHARGPRPRP